MGEYLKELAASLGVADKVVFRYEMLSEEERILHYAAADLCIFPSLYEPFGIVALEAMAMTKPVVVGARGISGMRESVVSAGPDQCGYHINPYDPRDLAWGVNNLLADRDQARKLGLKGRERVLKEFTWRRAAERTLKVYEETCGR
jgi:glycosyltransferase involved in cell wall biosynthesis